MRVDDSSGILAIDESMQTTQQIVDFAAEPGRVGIRRAFTKNVQHSGIVESRSTSGRSILGPIVRL